MAPQDPSGDARRRAAGMPGAVRRLARAWPIYGWQIIAALWVLALALGVRGWLREGELTEAPIPALDAIYRTLQLIPLNAGESIQPENWQLQIARYLIPFLGGWTAVRALLSLSRHRWQQFLLRFWRGHVVICGMSRKGWLLAQGFVAQRRQVVVIETDEAHALVGPARVRGIVVLTGDATDPETLRRAGAPRAEHVIAVTDDDGVNAEVAVRCQRLIREASAGKAAALQPPVTCTVHLVDPQLCELARTREMTLEAGLPLRLQLFNVFDRGARLLWAKYGPLPGARVAGGPGSGCAAHVVVVGLGRLGESLIVTACRDWHNSYHDAGCEQLLPLQITVIDLEAGWKCAALIQRYPQIPEVCRLTPLTMDVRGPEFYAARFLDGSEAPVPDAVFVCFDDDSLGLRTALVLHERLLQVRVEKQPARPPVVVRMSETGGLSRLIDAEDDGANEDLFANLHAFDLLDRTCTPEAMMAGTHEVLARALHHVYRQQQAAVGMTPAANAAMVEWEQLSAFLQASNRSEADGILSHLRLLGFSLKPLTDWDAAFFEFTAAEAERLARLEHGRWTDFLLEQGYRPTDGPRDPASLRHPSLLPWEQLPASEREKSLAAMARLPLVLARAGFQIVPVASDAHAAHPQPSGSPAPVSAIP